MPLLIFILILYIVLTGGILPAMAQSSVIDFAPLVNQVIMPLAIAVLGAVGTWAVVRFKTWLGIKQTSQLATTLDTALQNGLAFAQSQLPGVVANMPLSLATKNDVLAVAANYAITHVPDTLKALGVDQAMLLQKLEARLSINTTPSEQSIAVPNAPVVAPAGSPPVLSGPKLQSHWLTAIVSILLMYALVGCAALTSNVSVDDLKKAKAISYGLDSVYATALSATTTWAKQPRCGATGAPPVPLCSTAIGVFAAEKLRVQARTALDRLNTVIADTTTSTPVLEAAISTAQSAVAVYSDISTKH